MRSTFMMAGLASCLLAASAHAQPADKQLAKLQEDAVTYYNKKQYNKALEAFQKMYQLDPNPVLLYNIGRCQESLGKKKEALGSYTLFLEKTSPSTENYAKAQKSAAALEKEVGPLTPKEPPKPFGERLVTMKPVVYYGAAGAFTAAGSTFGVISLKNAFNLRNRPEDNTFGDSGAFARKMRISAISSDLSFVVAGALALYGYKRSRAPEVSLSISPTSASLAWEF